MLLLQTGWSFSSNKSNKWFRKLGVLPLLHFSSVILSGNGVISIGLTVFHDAEKTQSRCGAQICSLSTSQQWSQFQVPRWPCDRKGQKMCSFSLQNNMYVLFYSSGLLKERTLSLLAPNECGEMPENAAFSSYTSWPELCGHPYAIVKHLIPKPRT